MWLGVIRAALRIQAPSHGLCPLGFGLSGRSSGGFKGNQPSETCATRSYGGIHPPVLPGGRPLAFIHETAWCFLWKVMLQGLDLVSLVFSRYAKNLDVPLLASERHTRSPVLGEAHFCHRWSRPPEAYRSLFECLQFEANRTTRSKDATRGSWHRY